jgi:hypothetical protein
MKTVARSISPNVLVCSGLQPRWLQTRGITLGGESGSLLPSERYRHDTDVYPRENCIVFYISRVSPEAKSNAVTLRIKYGIILKKSGIYPNPAAESKPYKCSMAWPRTQGYGTGIGTGTTWTNKNNMARMFCTWPL